MKKNTLHTFLTYTTLAFLTVATLTSCEDVVDSDVKSGPPQLVVDGWVTNQQTSQTIRLTESAGYFDNSPAKPVLNATVTVTDDKGQVLNFIELKKDGNYVWKPVVASDTNGRIGHEPTHCVSKWEPKNIRQ